MVGAARRGCNWRFSVSHATLDLSGRYRSVFAKPLPWATQIAGPFHVVKHANSKLDDCRRRAQNELFDHRGGKDPPFSTKRGVYSRWPKSVSPRTDERSCSGYCAPVTRRTRSPGTWYAKEAVRELYALDDEQLAAQWFDELVRDMNDPSEPIEIRSLGRTLKRWRDQMIA